MLDGRPIRTVAFKWLGEIRSKSRYTAAEKAKIIAAAELLRQAGNTITQAATMLAVSPRSLGKWVLARSKYKPAQVRYDDRDRCWRIWVYDSRRSMYDAQNGIYWWPLTWLRFASEEAARDHLDAYGEYTAVA